MNKLNIDEILLKQAKIMDKILVLLIQSGGFEFGSASEELMSFDTEEELLNWVDKFIQEEKEYDNEEDPWELREEKELEDIYKVTSYTNGRHWESGWEVHSKITVYYPGSSHIPDDVREPRHTFNVLKNLNL